MNRFIKVLSGTVASVIAISASLLGSAPLVNAAGISIDSNNFPDADFREFIESLDYDGNGILSQYETGISWMMFSGNRDSLTDITGIEYFTKLESLKLNYCRLGDFDAGIFDNLEELVIYNSQLTSIDVSECPNLENLVCESTNLTSLDVSNCPNLEELNCNDNKISSLDLSKNTNLQMLACAENEFTSINLVPSLVFVNCCFNKISNLNLSRLTNLKTIHCTDNNLTSIDVSNCTNLVELNCANNQITSIDLSNNKNLEDLWIQSNQLTELNVRRLTGLEELNCSDNQLNELDISMNVSLNYLSCCENNFSSINIGNNPLLLDAYIARNFYAGTFDSGLSYYEYFVYNDETGFYNFIYFSPGLEFITTTPEQPTVGPIPAPVVTPAPEKSAGDFVERCYQVALGRPSDEEGFNSWLGQLNNGEACGAQVGFGFIFSGEYQNKNTTNDQYVKDLYAMFFGREADASGFEYWLSELNAGKTREEVFAGFSNSEEFNNLCNQYGVVAGTYVEGIPASQQGGVNCFVARLYKTCLNRLPDMVGQSGWVMKLMNGELTGTDAARGFVFSQEFIDLGLTNEEYVAYMYRAFFGREPDEAGFNAWVTELIDGVSRAKVFAGFAKSNEFSNLCASYGINA